MALDVPVDRRGLAEAYGVLVRDNDQESALSVGNGTLCFTVDASGLQTWPERYPVTDPAGGTPGTLLGTLSDWGWHSMPGADGYDVSHCARPYATRRGPVPYADLSRELGGLAAADITAEEAWLRGNPHRLDLMRMGFVVPAGAGPRRLAWQPPGLGEGLGTSLGAGRGEADGAHGFGQRLDLWTGVIASSFLLRGCTVTVRTCCHPTQDVIAVRIESALLGAGQLAVRLAFPYGSQSWSNAADWTRPQAHATDVAMTGSGCVVARSLDGTPAYSATVGLSAGGAVTVTGPHELVVSSSRNVVEITVRLSLSAADPGGYQAAEDAARAWWAQFWSRGAAVDVTGSADPRAGELQRRIMLSQYLTAVNCAGSMPPQETGLLANSWSGKFHLEMHWWHTAHFALWGRPDLLERSLGWYATILPAARRIAADQGYAGARWPKSCGPEGNQTPSPIGPFLVWQQPHPIYLAELARVAGVADAGERYAEIVFESAEFMASFADATPRGYQLGPPVIPAQECYAADRARLANPAFELAYWCWALGVAARWRARLGLPAEPRWDAVAAGLAAPCVRDGVYAAVSAVAGGADGAGGAVAVSTVAGGAGGAGSAGTVPRTVRGDHPSMLYAYGVVPPTRLIDPAVMRATLRSVLADWDWASTWGWDFPAIAMTAARLGLPGEAVEALLMDVPKNRYLPNGHNWQSPSLPGYLPGNGGLLAAVALMARAQAFPAGWTVTHEGLISHDLS